MKKNTKKNIIKKYEIMSTSSEDIIYEEEAFHGITVKAATIDKLIQHCWQQFDYKFDTDETPPSPVEDIEEDENEEKKYCFNDIFFLTYHWFISPEELLRKFVELYEKSGESNTISNHVQIVKAVKYWIDNFGTDYEKNDTMQSILNELNTKVMDTLGGGNGFCISLNMDKWNERKEIHRMRLESSKRRPSLNFNDMNGEALGEQFLYLNWKSLRKIPMSEWKLYGKSAKTGETPFLKEQIMLFNNISKYVMAMVLNHKTAEERAKSIHKFIGMARRLQELNDYNTLLAVTGGLGHSCINRLHKTIELLSVEDKLFIKETHQLLASEKNYSRYRGKIEDMSTEWQVPILGVVMHDLVALETVLKDRIEVGEQKLINFHKLVQVSGILKHVLKASNEQPNVFPKKEVFNIIRVSLKSRYSEDDLYELSLQREPRINGSTSRMSISENAFFAEWASGEVTTPDRHTVEKHVRNMVEAVFKTYDLDRNGSINKEEFDTLATNFPFIDNFAVLDVNCDGNISRQEMLNYFMNVNSQEMTKEFLHNFQEHSFYSPHYCVYCMGFLWGIGKSGYRCKDCQISCHKDCKSHVVMECRPSLRNGTGSLPRSLSVKSHKRRMKYADAEWRGSTDSQLSGSDADYPSPRSSTISSMNDVFSRSFDFPDQASDARLRQKILQLEKEKDQLKKENTSLKTELVLTKDELRTTKTSVKTLESQLTVVRQQSVKFMLEQMERLQTCKETDV